jgi:hypothetical protein
VKKYRPVVKFRSLDEATLQDIQTCGTDDDPNDVDVEDEDESDDDSDDEMEPDPVADCASPTRLEPVAFQVDADINIDSKGLKDMVSVDAVVREVPHPQKEPVKVAPQAPITPDWNW